ncbi:MAG: 2-oxoacid:acceptor oxidoreductase subunit alpha [Chloroflexi bacterium]|nr:2-oxoacid:acceptor oxidoreductase subunit alpha [Chloroflexota bacterium]
MRICMQKIVNEFSILVSTVNGSGSATANNAVMKAIYKMGIPISARNIFPSNIQGLPTWYSLRISEKGYLGRVDEFDILINLNKTVLQDDVRKLKKGGLILCAQPLLGEFNEEYHVIEMPVDHILEEAQAPSNLHVYLMNMVYVGFLAALIGIDLTFIEDTLNSHFKNVRKAVEPNMKVVRIAHDLVTQPQIRDSSFTLQKREPINDHIVTDGNKAAALGALFGGLQFSAWYPITPATELAETLNEYNHQLRLDPETGKATCVVIQAEDELAAVGMTIGAGWAGLRSMTSTSGPGLCLMSEYLGLAYQSEVPLVVWDVQRVGPSTGLPTRTSQGDLSFSYFLSHGDTEYVILLPGNVHECFEFGWRALDIAEEMQSPVLVLSDLELGMNNWMTPKFTYPDQPILRGKIIREDEISELIKRNGGSWGRYQDVDGDSIPYRTIPGDSNPQAAYFARGTGHDAFADYSEDPQVWQQEHHRLKRKFKHALEIDPEPVLERDGQSKVGFISYGSTHFGVIEACDLLAQAGQEIDYLRIRSIPFQSQVEKYLEEHEQIYVVEANRDGQMAQILMLNYPQYAGKIKKIACLDGLSLTANKIYACFNGQENSI